MRRAGHVAASASLAGDAGCPALTDPLRRPPSGAEGYLGGVGRPLPRGLGCVRARKRLGGNPPPRRPAGPAVDEVPDPHASSSGTASNSAPLGKPSDEAIGASLAPFCQDRRGSRARGRPLRREVARRLVCVMGRPRAPRHGRGSWREALRSAIAALPGPGAGDPRTIGFVPYRQAGKSIRAPLNFRSTHGRRKLVSPIGRLPSAGDVFPGFFINI